MTEEATETVAPAAVSRQDAIAAAGAAADGEAPVLTTEDVAGEKPAAPDAQADRELVAPSIREFLRAQRPAEPAVPTALEKEIGDLREALDGIAGKNTPQATVEETMLAKLEALENRFATQEQRDAEAAEAEAYNNRVRTMREGVIANIDAQAEKFPGVIALGQQETAFNALVQRENEGTETSEVEIASEMEAGLREVYATLHKVYSSAPSEEIKPASEAKQTLTPALSSTEEAPDLDKMSVADRKEYLWNKHQPNKS